MEAIVKLNDVVDQLEMLLSDESTAYLNRRTGELYMLTDEELWEAEDEDEEEPDGETPAETPEWLREAIEKAREVTNSDDWLALPSKFDIHEYKIMEDFCRTFEDEDMRARLLGQIRGCGAFGRFRAMMEVLGLEQIWWEFRHNAFEEIAVDWLEENQIEFTREAKKRARAN